MRSWRMEISGLTELFNVLRAQNYKLAGPQIRDGAIVYDELSSVEKLPRGWIEDQGAGSYRLKKDTEDAFFRHTVGAHSWKKFFLPPRRTIWKMEQRGGELHILPQELQLPSWALFGIRGCDLHAIHKQDQILCEGAFVDPYYKAARDASFLIVTECLRAGQNCFCTSMETGPAVDEGFDLALTELLTPEHFFLVRAGSKKGEAVLQQLSLTEAATEDIERAKDSLEAVSQQMGRTLQTEGLKERIEAAIQHKHWEDVAKRCLGCTNCTMVCPTCFCTNVEDTTDLTGSMAERTKVWDSCFQEDFSYIHGGPVRASLSSRYRQWLTHKLSSWHDQFGSSGCVGCGRCIAWCPAGIDLTQEVLSLSPADEENS